MITPSPPSRDAGGDRDAELRSAHPPLRFAPVRQWVLHHVTELHSLRDGLRQTIDDRARLREDQLLDGVAHAAVLVASELATNALRHGRPPAIVELLQRDASFLLTVTDHDPSSRPHIATDRAPGEGGFGLQIARRLSLDVGWYRADPVKILWAEIGA